MFRSIYWRYERERNKNEKKIERREFSRANKKFKDYKFNVQITEGLDDGDISDIDLFWELCGNRW